MNQKTDRLYPSAPLQQDDLEQRLEKKLNDVNSFNNSINNIKEMATYFKEKNNRSEKKYENLKTLITLLESVDTVVVISSIALSVTLSITRFGLIAVPISAGIFCSLSAAIKMLHRLLLNKSNIYKEQYGRDQETIKSFDKLHRKVFQDNLIDKNEYESL